ncbi:hypothetical protein HDU79_003464, partial [Rhizoclosmatium sp. JEL0117]
PEPFWESRLWVHTLPPTLSLCCPPSPSSWRLEVLQLLFCQKPAERLLRSFLERTRS